MSGRDCLELHEADGALERIEAWLRDRGFFAAGGEGLVADLYLGYGLSSTIRRHDTPLPPEPCPLPLAACSVRPARVRCRTWQRRRSRPASVRPVGADLERRGVRGGGRARARGDRAGGRLPGQPGAASGGGVRRVDPGAIAACLAPLSPHNREPFRGDGWAVVSGSPERFLARRGRRIWTCPIKGTRPAGPSAARELARSEKDAAEHVMIVDLERNDLSRVCEPGSVRWPELMATRALAGVEHMVSTVEGTLRAGVGLAELLQATFPGGSITGAPKIAAVDLIAELEPVGRGASMGALGRVYGNGDARPGADDPDLRDRRGTHPSLGRRGRRLGLGSPRRDRRVVGQGRPAAPRDRSAARGHVPRDGPPEHAEGRRRPRRGAA